MREKAEKAPCDNARFRSVCGTFNPTFHGYSSGISDEKCRAFFDGACTVYRADNRRVYDHRVCIDRALSSSYSLKEGDERFAAYVQARGEIFRSLCGRRAHHRADGHGHVYRKGLNRKRLPRLREKEKAPTASVGAFFETHYFPNTREKKPFFSSAGAVEMSRTV